MRSRTRARASAATVCSDTRRYDAGLVQAGHHVGGSRTRAPQGNAQPARRPRIPIGHVRGALLVTSRDELDTLGAADHIDDRHVMDADDAEDVTHARLHQ